MEDVLSEILRRTALRGTVYFRADFGAPWAMEIGDKEVSAFHIVVRGRCWVRGGSEQLLELGPGDIVMFPHGDRHALLHDRRARPVPAEELLADGTDDEGTVSFGGSGQPTTLICGHFERDARVEHPLFATLPARVHVPATSARDAKWMATATELAVLESATGRPGSAAVVDRLAEVLLIQVLRAWAEMERAPEGFLSALADEGLARAIALTHQHPERPWSVEDLARAAGVSRSAFAARFRERVGKTPMGYLTDWRMRLAHDLLVTTERSMADIAERVGYDSEWAFAKAFKRVWGVGPGLTRREARKTA